MLLSPAIAARLYSVAEGGKPENALNDREREVLGQLVSGARNKEIAAALFITTSTVEYHLSHIFEKLDVSNRTEAVKVALENKLLG